MNGSQVRDTWFCRAGATGVAGYDAPQVNDLCRRIAAELDAGGSAGPLIHNASFRRLAFGLRYDVDAVDWFLDQFLLHGDGGLGRIGDDPWGDLPVARAAQASDEKFAFEVQCDSAWRDFGQVPGTRLWFGKAARGSTELRTAEQQTLASGKSGRQKKSLSWSGGSAEIVVHPGRKLTDELALALALSADWLRTYFARPEGGGCPGTAASKLNCGGEGLAVVLLRIRQWAR